MRLSSSVAFRLAVFAVVAAGILTFDSQRAEAQRRRDPSILGKLYSSSAQEKLKVTDDEKTRLREIFTQAGKDRASRGELLSKIRLADDEDRDRLRADYDRIRKKHSLARIDDIAKVLGANRFRKLQKMVWTDYQKYALREFSLQRELKMTDKQADEYRNYLDNRLIAGRNVDLNDKNAIEQFKRDWDAKLLGMFPRKRRKFLLENVLTESPLASGKSSDTGKDEPPANERPDVTKQQILQRIELMRKELRLLEEMVKQLK